MNELYKPKGSINLSEDSAKQQVRLGVQGYGKTGKTWSGLTFPNPVVMNLDRGLGAHKGRADVIDVPFYSPSFCDTIFPRSGTERPPNRRDAILKWLSTEALRLTKEQTLVMDGGTVLENAFHAQYKLEPVISRSTGKEDNFAEWRLKNDYFAQVFDLLKATTCDVIYLCHETADRSATGDLNGRVRPILTGQFGDKLVGNCTDWFRQWAVAKPSTEDELSRFTKKFCSDSKELAASFVESTPKEHKTIYIWQTTSDDVATCGTSTLLNVPKFIVASYQSFLSYERK